MEQFFYYPSITADRDCLPCYYEYMYVVTEHEYLWSFHVGPITNWQDNHKTISFTISDIYNMNILQKCLSFKTFSVITSVCITNKPLTTFEMPFKLRRSQFYKKIDMYYYSVSESVTCYMYLYNQIIKHLKFFLLFTKYCY